MTETRRVRNRGIYGRWIVLEYQTPKSRCICSLCRRIYQVGNAELLNGGSTKCKSCAARIRQKGRLKRKILPHLLNKDYMKLATSVENSLARCRDMSPGSYGERGIKVCKEWLDDKRKFIEYLATLPGCLDPELELDRTDNDGHYEPGNLRFVSHSVSMFNRRRFGHKQCHDAAGRFSRK